MKGRSRLSLGTTSTGEMPVLFNSPAISETDDPFPLQLQLPLQVASPAKDDAKEFFGAPQNNRTVFPVSPRSDSFRLTWFPSATLDQWNDWRWQLRNRFTSFDQLAHIMRLSDEESAALKQPGKALPVSITPYYASLLDICDCASPLRRTVVPVSSELIASPGESGDPLNEGADSPVRGIVHRYPDRALFLVTTLCSTYCRYCTRSRIVGHDSDKHRLTRDSWERAIGYIESHTEIRDVLLSGGDPLLLPAEALEYLLARLRSIKHVEILRIGTKVPMVLPQRITRPLVRILKRYHPLWMSIHCTHPDEHTEEARAACATLADAGIPLGSQTVLLSGINDNPETMKRLFHNLLTMRVRPYYIYQCDPIIGSAHFRTPIEKGVKIIESLRGFTSGLAVPHYVIDAPGGGGKIPVCPDYVVNRTDGAIVLRNFEGKEFLYPQSLPDSKSGREVA